MNESPFLIETQYWKSSNSKDDESRGQKWIRQERELRRAMDQSLLEEVQRKLTHMKTSKKQADYYMIDIDRTERDDLASSHSSREKAMKKFRKEQLTKKLDIFKISHKIASEQLGHIITPKLSAKNKRVLSQSVNFSFYCQSPTSTTQFWRRKPSKSKPGISTPKTSQLKETSFSWESPKRMRRSSVLTANIQEGNFRDFSSQPSIQLSTIRVDKKFTLQKLQSRYGHRIA